MLTRVTTALGRPEQRTWSVGEFFDEEGVFQEEAFEAEVKAFLTAYEAQVRGM
jgi:hypothetical protein